jgi:hypothetical protein
MEINARTATAADFDTAAQKHANAAWFWVIVTGVTYYFFEGWAVISGMVFVWFVISSIGATKQAFALGGAHIKSQILTMARPMGTLAIMIRK